nr:MAG TPA: hypothetical protein [Caudoviricetes sp.]
MFKTKAAEKILPLLCFIITNLESPYYQIRYNHKQDIFFGQKYLVYMVMQIYQIFYNYKMFSLFL